MNTTLESLSVQVAKLETEMQSLCAKMDKIVEANREAAIAIENSVKLLISDTNKVIAANEAKETITAVVAPRKNLKTEFVKLFISNPQEWSTIVTVENYLEEGKPTEKLAKKCYSENYKISKFAMYLTNKLK